MPYHCIKSGTINGRTLLRCAIQSSLLAATLLVTACAPIPLPSIPVQPAPDDERALAPGTWRIDAQQSLIAVTVHRGGTLARLGHDHVVASRNIEGHATMHNGADGTLDKWVRADLQFRLDELTVDEPGLRAQAGFDTQPDADAIAGTRRNMLNRVLQAEHFPLVLIHATLADTGEDIKLKARDDAKVNGNVLGTLNLSITLHGVTRTMAALARIEAPGAGTIAVSGNLRLNQSDFGIVPFSVLGGALAVQDGLDLQYRIVANQGRSGRSDPSGRGASGTPARTPDERH